MRNFVLIALLFAGFAFVAGFVMGEHRVLTQPCAVACSIPESLR